VPTKEGNKRKVKKRDARGEIQDTEQLKDKTFSGEKLRRKNTREVRGSRKLKRNNWGGGKRETPRKRHKETEGEDLNKKGVLGGGGKEKGKKTGVGSGQKQLECGGIMKKTHRVASLLGKTLRKKETFGWGKGITKSGPDGGSVGGVHEITGGS